MADLPAITPANVKPVEVIEKATAPAHEAIDAGEIVIIDPTTGEASLGDASAAGTAAAVGVSLTNAGVAGQTITYLRKGIVDLGPAVLSALSFADPVYLSDTTGKMGDAVGTVTKIVGTVVPGFGATAADKLLRLDL